MSDTVADSRNEPSFNPAMAGVELLTPPPIGLGTRFRARMGQGRHRDAGGVDRVHRPHRSVRHDQLDDLETSGALTFAAEGEGHADGLDWQAHPKGWMRMLGRLGRPLGGRMERNLDQLKHQLETNGPARSA